MKKLSFIFILAIAIHSVCFADGPTFTFIKKSQTKESVEVFFEPKNSFPAKKLLLELKNLSFVTEARITEQGYIGLLMKDQSNNDQIRTVLLNHGTDIDPLYVVVRSKNYYLEN